MSAPEQSHELIQKYLEDLASESEIAELEHLLSTDPQVANAFADAARLHSVLTSYFRKQYIVGQVAALLKSSEESSTIVTGSHAAEVPPPPALRDTGTIAETSSRSTFVPGVFVRTTGSQDRFRLRIRRVKQVTAALALLVCGIALMLVWPTASRRAHLVSGQASIAGHAIVSEIPADAKIDVGMSPAVIDFGDGASLRLGADSQVVIRHESHQTVVEISAGSGEFTVPASSAARLPFLVSAPQATVATTGGRFTLQVVPNAERDIPTSDAGPRPSLMIEVAEGSIQVQHAGGLLQLAAGDKRVFFGSIAG